MMKVMKFFSAAGVSGCLLVLASCLGDTDTQLTMANQAGVVTTQLPTAGKAVYVKGGDAISSEKFQTANVSDGECILFDYSIDFSASENADGGAAQGYLTATIYDNTIAEVSRWPVIGTLIDTARVLPRELLLGNLQTRSAYIEGMLFLFAEMNNRPRERRDSFMLSYNPAQHVEADGVYDLYLRVMQVSEIPDSVRGVLAVIPCAFRIGPFVDSVARAGGTEEIRLRVNYASSFGRDSLAVDFESSDIMTVNVAGSE